MALAGDFVELLHYIVLSAFPLSENSLVKRFLSYNSFSPVFGRINYFLGGICSDEAFAEEIVHLTVVEDRLGSELILAFNRADKNFVGHCV